MKKQIYWAGFVDNKLHITTEEFYGQQKIMAIYPTEKNAKRAFMDVRPVEVKIQRKAKR